MSRRSHRGVALLAVLSLAAVASCFFWPERWAVNAPLLNLVWGRPGVPPETAVMESRLQPPAGLSIVDYAHVPSARWLLATGEGDLLVSVPREGRIVLLEHDADGDGRADAVRTLLADLSRPHGMDLHNGWLYVAETGAVGRVRFDPKTGAVSGSFERVVTGLPGGGNHWTRTVRFGPDGWMYVAVGSSCNACEEESPRRAALLRFQPDGSAGEIYASGLRNSVGFDWRPGTGELYATDNGRDLLGDDFPPCELNRVVKGGFYGWPYAHGDREPDPDFGAGHESEISTSIPPAHDFRAHNAPLGIHFLRRQSPGSSFADVALVALHGSWNRTQRDGYKVVALRWSPDGEIREEDFLSGFLEDGDVIGRPVDVAEAHDGAIYVSDDFGGVIYRLARGGVSRVTAAPAEATQELEPVRSPAEVAAAAERGRALYEGHRCYDCHEPERAAAGVVPIPLRDLAARFRRGDLAALLAAPTPPMPLYDLSPAERSDLADHLLPRDPAPTAVP